MTPEEALIKLRELHKRVPSAYGIDQCEECASNCHSHEGLYCDEPDAAYPCATMQLVEAVSS